MSARNLSSAKRVEYDLANVLPGESYVTTVALDGTTRYWVF